ncbi:hypothetical protein ACFQYP_31560 [Nonomuraea antimicrobica]
MRAQRAVSDAGTQAHRLAEHNAGRAQDALDEHVAGKSGVLVGAATRALVTSVAASVLQVTQTTIKWAGGLIVGLAGLAGLALAFPHTRALLIPRLRQFGQRAQQWIRTAMQSIGRLFTQLTERLRGTSARQRAGDALAAEQRRIAAGSRLKTEQQQIRQQAYNSMAVHTKAGHARIAAGRVASTLNRHETTLKQVETYVAEAKRKIAAAADEAYARGRIDAGTRARLLSTDRGLANHPLLDDMSRWHLSQQAQRVEQIESRLSGHVVVGQLREAGHRVNEGLNLAGTRGVSTRELDDLQGILNEQALRRREMLDRAWLARQDLRGNYEILPMYPL